MKIAIDLDNTLFTNTVVEDVIKEFNLKLKSHYHWELKELGKKGQAECMKRFKNPLYMCNLKSIRGNKTKIKKWAKAGHELVCVTARDMGIADPSFEMIKKHYPEIKRAIFCGSYNKTHIYAKEKFDIVIDDSPNNIKEALQFRKIKKIFFITNKNTPYNWDFSKSFKRSKRVINVIGIKDISI